MSNVSRTALSLLLLAGACQLDATNPHEVASASDGLFADPLPIRGVNLAGAEFSASEDGAGDFPGIPGTNYTYPYPGAPGIDYSYDTPTRLKSLGATAFRLPFRWERLQPQLNQPFDTDELARLSAAVDYLLGDDDVQVILDPHNYARYHTDLIGSAAVPNTAFADFWTRLATLYVGEPRVVFGLINEPHHMPTEQWHSAAVDALAAIRATGAQNLVLVPGNDYSGAAGWTVDGVYGTANAIVFDGFTDPANNFAFDLHTYFDTYGSGSELDCVPPAAGYTSIASQRLTTVTAWLEDKGYRAVLSEFGGAPTATCIQAIDDALDYLEAHSDVWLGYTYWAAGPWWNWKDVNSEDPSLLIPSIEPAPDGEDAPQLATLVEHFGWTGATTSPSEPEPPSASTIVYDDALAAGWADWSWPEGSSMQVSSPAMGSSAFQMSFGEISGWKLAHATAGVEQPIDPNTYSSVVLHLNPGSSVSPALSTLSFRLGNGSSSVLVSSYATLAPDTWTEVRIPLADANSLGAPFSVLELNDASGVTLGIDSVSLEAAATTPTGPLTYQSADGELAVDGVTRRYILDTPTPAPGPLPLVIALHGDMGTSTDFRTGFGLATEEAAAGAAVFAYPQSASSYGFDYNTLAGRQAEVAFVQALISTLAAEGRIRSDRVFITGMSGGAAMANSLGCMLGAGVIRAVGAMSGSLYSVGGDFTVTDDGVASCDLPPVRIIWGQNDTGEGTKYASDGIYTLAKYTATAGCDATTQTSTPSGCVAYDGCERPVEWCAVPGMGHAVWSDAPTAIWSFFARQL